MLVRGCLELEDRPINGYLINPGYDGYLSEMVQNNNGHVRQS